MTFSFIQMSETSQRASSPRIDVATADEIKVSEVVSAETVIERLIELRSARSTSDLATLGRSPLSRSRCSKTPKFAISDETLSVLSCNQDHRELQRSFNGRLRDELLNEKLFRSLPHARAVLEAWRRDYTKLGPIPSSAGWRLRSTLGRSAASPAGALRYAKAPRPGLSPPITQKGPTQPRTLVIPG
jgi:hypothetical protein